MKDLVKVMTVALVSALLMCSALFLSSCRTTKTPDNSFVYEFDPVMATFVYETTLRTINELEKRKAEEDEADRLERQQDIQELWAVANEVARYLEANGVKLPVPVP